MHTADKITFSGSGDEPLYTIHYDFEDYPAAMFRREAAGIPSQLAVPHCHQEVERHPTVLAQLAHRVWEVPETDQDEREAAQAGIRAFAEFLRELELPTEYSELDDVLRCHLKQSAPAQNLLVYTA